jgi:tRNA(Ile2) C34 agmatinyltransferase TiaS
MSFMRYTAVRSSAEVISGILNCVCPECGGRMGERGEEFRCQGECLTDWRQTWERASANFQFRPKQANRKAV